MIGSKTVKNIVRYVTEGFMAIFSPAKDNYPATGVQPYEGTINPHNAYDE